MKTVLVTGANRGIGLGICKHLAALDFRVFLTARNRVKGEAAVEELRENFKNVSFISLDVDSRDSIRDAYQVFRKEAGNLDVLINNAGVLSGKDVNVLSKDELLMARTLHTNAIAPLMVTSEFEPALMKGSRIINISSGGGSMDDEVGGWAPFYCISKTTLNAITRHLDFLLYPKGILVNSMCPGWVKTDMGGPGATRTISQGAETAVWLATAALIPHGKFIRDKKIIPW